MRFTNVSVCALLLLGPPAFATHTCTSPLILDLNGDPIRLYGTHAGVSFDIDGDGEDEEVAWTNPHSQEGFFWLDRNNNHIVDDGRELFGTATFLPTGEPASNGFEALASFDEPSQGGDGGRCDLRGRLDLGGSADLGRRESGWTVSRVGNRQVADVENRGATARLCRDGSDRWDRKLAPI